MALSLDVLFWCSIIFALSIKSWFGLLLFPVGIGISYFVLVNVTELKPITGEEVKKSRIISIAAIGGIVLVAAILDKFG